MRIAILDDCLDELKYIQKFTYDYFDLINRPVNIDTFQDPITFLNINFEKYDFLVLDILLKNSSNGIELASEIRKIDKNIKIIFCSNSKDFSIDAFDVKAYSYILKPIDKFEYFRKLDNLMKELKFNYIKFQDYEHFMHNICISDICYIEVFNKKTTVHLLNKKTIKVAKSLYYWENLLSDSYFSICHKSILVNLRNIKNIEKNIINLNNEEIIYISRNYTKSLKSKWYNYLDDLL